MNRNQFELSNRTKSNEVHLPLTCKGPALAWLADVTTVTLLGVTTVAAAFVEWPMFGVRSLSIGSGSTSKLSPFAIELWNGSTCNRWLWLWFWFWFWFWFCCWLAAATFTSCVSNEPTIALTADSSTSVLNASSRNFTDAILLNSATFCFTAFARLSRFFVTTRRCACCLPYLDALHAILIPFPLF